MKTFQKAPLAMAVAALMTAPYALADNHVGYNDFYTNASLDTAFTNTIEVDLRHESDTEKEFDIGVDVDKDAENYSGATVDSKQAVDYNQVTNRKSSNNATVGGRSGQGSSGNIGINVAAGDNNAQANDAALSASDAADVFGQAAAYSAQSSSHMHVSNHGSPNDAALTGNALRGATGNIGVNVAAGVGNAQQNSLAASSNTATGSTRATVGGQQMSYNNTTDNAGVVRINSHKRFTLDMSGVTGDISGIGTYDGSWEQTNDVYPEIWKGGTLSGNHNSGASYWGHADFDDKSNSGEDGRFEGDEGGTLEFKGTEDIQLSGVATGHSWGYRERFVRHSNDATLDGNALRGASGNIGVNVAAGTNNMQRNSMAIASSTGGGNER